MSMNATRGDFVHDYVVAQPRPGVRPGRIALMAMIVVLMLVSVAAGLGRGAAVDAQGGDTSNILMQGP